jgi:hypothetical protein
MDLVVIPKGFYIWYVICYCWLSVAYLSSQYGHMAKMKNETLLDL